MPEVLVSIAHEGLAVMTIYFGLFLWYFDEAVLPKVLLLAGRPQMMRLSVACVAQGVGHAVLTLGARSAVPINTWRPRRRRTSIAATCPAGAMAHGLGLLMDCRARITFVEATVKTVA